MTSLKRVIGIATSIFGPVLTRPLTQELESSNIRSHAIKWVPAIIVTLYATVIEGDDINSLGVRWDGFKPFVKRSIGGLGILLGANVVLAPIHERIGTDDLVSGMAEYTNTTLPGRLFIALTAGLTEELLYRGYALERLEDETNSRLIAAVGSVLVFVLAHKSDQWGWESVALIAQPATILTLLYLRSRDLLAVMTAHALNDALGLITLERSLDKQNG